jgi:rare lipoprotein A
MKVILLKRHLLLLLPLILLAGCAVKEEGGARTYPKGSQTGIASWYGKDFHGRPTASGEIYNMYAMTAAHRTLPLGTFLLVTNLENGNSVKVTVNDRGPFVKGRIIDLSYSAFKRLDRPEKGTTRVMLEVLGRDTKYVRYIKFEKGGKGPYVVQLGSFANRRNAGRLKDALSWKYRDVYITRVNIYGKDFYRVRVGKFKKREKAHKLAGKLAEEGYEVVVMSE